jgi:phosphate butyryltransferase
MQLLKADELDITDYILVGDEKKIIELSKDAGFEVKKNKIYNEPNNIKAVNMAVELVKSNKADILMKGFVNTDDFLRGVLNRETGLRTGKIMSHVYVLESSALKRMLFITDGSVNILPDLETKCSIILNSIYLANIFEIEDPKVAITTAIELLTPKCHQR